MKKLLLVFVALAASCFAAGGKYTVTQKWMDATAAYWQHVLKLDDWTVQVDMGTVDQLRGAWGRSKPLADRKVLAVLVMNPACYGEAETELGLPLRSAKEIQADIENTILHELLHLRVHDIAVSTGAETSDDEIKAEEIVVNRLTDALLAEHKGHK